jgi:hypothetical protein
MSEKYIKSVDWNWTQGNFGFQVVLSLTDKDHETSVELKNYDFFVNVQRGENPRNVFQAPCHIIDIDSKRVEYNVREGDLSIGDEYYYIELQGIKKNPLNEDLGNVIKISSQEVVRVFVRSAKEERL